MSIKTHHAPHCDPPWLAVDMDKAAESLAGYKLTNAERSDIAELMASYCRLVEDAGLCYYGATEQEAIKCASA